MRGEAAGVSGVSGGGLSQGVGPDAGTRLLFTVLAAVLMFCVLICKTGMILSHT